MARDLTRSRYSGIEKKRLRGGLMGPRAPHEGSTWAGLISALW